MQFIPIVLRSVLIITLFSGIVSGVTGSEKPVSSEQTLEAIRNCMARSPGPWPDEWKKEYVETIHKVIKSHRDVTHYTLRLEILGKGFESYWGSFKKTQERSLFEVHSNRIRWYIEHLMSTEFPSEDEIKKLRDQYTDIWDHAASSLLKQFPFLDPNAIEQAKAEDLQKVLSQDRIAADACISETNVRGTSWANQQRWGKLRYVRVDLWRRLGGGSKTLSENNNTKTSSNERDYELTKKSLSQLLG